MTMSSWFRRVAVTLAGALLFEGYAFVPVDYTPVR